jgi:hypothetical protein
MRLGLRDSAAMKAGAKSVYQSQIPVQDLLTVPGGRDLVLR